MEYQRNMEELADRMTVFIDFQRDLMGGFHPKGTDGLKKKEIRTLMQIKFNRGKPMSFYSCKVDLEYGSFTYVINKLEQRGFVERIDSKEDKRIKTLCLTDEGEALTDQLHSQMTSHMRNKLKVFDKCELDSLFQIINELEKLDLTLIKGKENE